MNGAELAKPPGRFCIASVKRLPVPRAPILSDAIRLEQLVVRQAHQPKIKAEALSALVRSFVALVDCIRELRGIPKAGQLRPDLDPVQMARQLKRIKARLPVDVEGSAMAIADELPAKQPTTKPKQKKESLLPPDPSPHPHPGGEASAGEVESDTPSHDRPET